MRTVLYDGTYLGWLTAVFDIYDHKIEDVVFARDAADSASLFATPHHVITDETKAARVLKGLEKRLSPDGLESLYKAFLSEYDSMDNTLLRFVRHAFASTANIEADLLHTAVWDVQQAAKRVRREAHRMKAFVRFQKTSDGLFYAIVEPACDVLPLIARHFKDRYADQRWLIYDAHRKYGLHYDLDTVTTVSLNFTPTSSTDATNASIFDEREEFFQILWRRYFSSVNIEARKNLKLHVQHMPKKYWRHLTEKRPGVSR